MKLSNLIIQFNKIIKNENKEPSIDEDSEKISVKNKPRKRKKSEDTISSDIDKSKDNKDTVGILKLPNGEKTILTNKNDLINEDDMEIDDVNNEKSNNELSTSKIKIEPKKNF